MFAGTPKLSTPLQALIDKGLFERLPATFSTFFFDQIKDWEQLFPAEKSYYERLFGLFDRSAPADVDRLFAPVRQAEQLMGVTERNWPRKQFTLDQVDFLNRSAHYKEWRAAIAGLFAQVDPLLDAEIARHGKPRLVIVNSPADLPVGPDRMWLRIAAHGKRIPLIVPEDAADYLPLLLTGAAKKAAAPTLADLYARGKGSPYGAWAIDADDVVTSLSREGSVVRLSYKKLEPYRLRLMREVQHIVDTQDVKGPRQLGAKLKELKIRSGEGELGSDPVLAEFARAVLLSGNGTLLVNNTFVEWAATQAVRRARPSVALLGFGIRNKAKPFSSLLIYTDQEAASPIPTQADMLGSYVDLEVFYQYVWQEFTKYVEYRANTAFLFVGEGMDELLAIAPTDFPLLSATQPVKLADVFSSAREWMAL